MIRAYSPADKEEVLNLIRLNIPRYFAPFEEGDLSMYLDEESDHYFVVEENGNIIGAGGFNHFREERLARISWDLIHPNYHGRGIGSQLTRYRIKEIKKNFGVPEIQVRTTQLVYRFYEKMGFSTLATVKDFWAPGFDLYDMRLIFP